MVYHFNNESWRHLMRLRAVDAEFHRSNETSQRFLATAAKLDDDVISSISNLKFYKQAMILNYRRINRQFTLRCDVSTANN
jgi:hypothetical protein